MMEKQSSAQELTNRINSEKPQPFSKMELTSFTSNFNEKLGSGTFGDVYKGHFPNSGAQVAVKVLKNGIPDVTQQQFIAELRTMGITYHQNLIKLYGFCFEDDMKALVYEFMENGSLDNVLYKNHRNVGWAELYDIAIGIAKGLSYLHESCREIIIHHDIKPDNVLLDSKLSPKITDFGLARLYDKNKSQVAQSRYRGTGGFAAPEVCFNAKNITFKCDVYSFGIMMFEILRKKKNDDGDNWFPAEFGRDYFENIQLEEILSKCGINENNKEKAKRLSMVALMCAQYNPQDRPLMSNVAKMLEGDIEPLPPLINPFLYYDFSSGESSMSGSSARTSSLPVTFDKSISSCESSKSGGSTENSSLPPKVSMSGGSARTSSLSATNKSNSGGSTETSSLPPKVSRSAASERQAMQPANPIAVIGPQYCASVPLTFTVIQKVRSINDGNLAVVDVKGNIMHILLRVRVSRSNFFQDDNVLLDANGYPLVTLRRTTVSAHNRWKAYRRDSSDEKDHLFTVKQSSVLSIRNQHYVFLASNTSQEEVCDFKIRGSWFARSCIIYLGDSPIIIAQMHKNHSAEGIVRGKDTYMVTVYPYVDYAFIVALLVILNEGETN